MKRYGWDRLAINGSWKGQFIAIRFIYWLFIFDWAGPPFKRLSKFRLNEG